MKSMTGYGKGMVAGDDFSVSVDLKTVNNRFLDIHLRVGSELVSVEPSIKKRITSRLSRERRERVVERVTELDEERGLAERQHARPFHAGGRTSMPSRRSASRTAAAMSRTPGVSPWKHSVSTSRGTN